MVLLPEGQIGPSSRSLQKYWVKKVKAYLELNLGRDLKGKKGFYRYISSKRKTRGNVVLLLNGTGDLVTKGLEKTEGAFKQTRHRHSPWDLMSSNRKRGNGFKLKEGRFRLDIRKGFFMMKVMKCWNRLPREVGDGPSLETFKVKLDRALSNLI
ncbi:hypothetical protein QYF61_024053 [Mycteria americana]|uniref:Uncharacterized protein n=1 Tax=Mycteria americana TaxID=33587 RepID=A0AAN7PWI4_MYCAM|nr:hypothetical protein QYF61_024053 [Mycteria americana]